MHRKRLLPQTYLTSYLYGKRATWLTLLQLKERAYILHIEHHSSVGNTCVSRSEIFDVGIVGSDDTIAASLKHTL